MKKLRTPLLVLLGILLVPVTIAMLMGSQYAWSIPAFPGAEGGGAAATGGRSPTGAVFMVTNLLNTGPGSLRACMEAAGPRTCIFRTGGNVILTDDIFVGPSKGNLTVAGQSAPGGGITLRGDSSSQNLIGVSGDATNVIIRYIRLRKGFNGGCLDECGNNFIGFGGNMILDHVSSSWNQDEGIAFRRGPNTTVQWNIIGEGLGPSHATSMQYSSALASEATAATNMDTIKTLMITHSHRNPTVRMRSGRLVNNIIYNNRRFNSRFSGGTLWDIIGNRYKAGPIRPTPAFHEISATALNRANGPAGEPSFFISQNTGYNQSNPAGNQVLLTANVPGDSSSADAESGPIPASRIRGTPLANTTFPITAIPNANVEATVLPIVGASRRLDCNGNWVMNRDAVDIRYINEYNTGTGRSADVTDEGQVGGYPAIAAGTPCPDSDLDGMPNDYESARPGLSNSNAADRNSDQDGNGYTELEEYLDGLPDGPGIPLTPIIGGSAVIETPGGRSATGKVEIKGGPERRPFGKGTAQ
jgi:hypothetical protein